MADTINRYPGSNVISLPSSAEAPLMALITANETLFDGPIDRIHNQKTPAVKRLAVSELMHRLRWGGIDGPDGARVLYETHENSEGSYYVYSEDSDDTFRYRVVGDCLAYLNGEEAFFFGKEDLAEVRVSTYADISSIRKFNEMLDTLNEALSSTLAELDETLAAAVTTFDDDQKERVAAALIKLNDDLGLSFGLGNGRWYHDFGGRLEIVDRYIARLDLVLEGAEELVALGVRINPIVFATLKKTISDLEDDVEKRTLDTKGNSKLQRRVRAALRKIMASITTLPAAEPAEAPAIAEAEKQRFTDCKASILAKLSQLSQTLADLEDADLIDALGNDKFVSLGLECLGHKLPKTE